MTEIIEPNPLLIKYWQIATELNSYSDGGKQEFIDAGQWHYIPSDLEKTILLFKRLEEVNLLPNKLDICDLGIGLGTTMFDLYLQSLDYPNIQFTFTGIELWKPYVDYVNQKLISLWNGNLNLILDNIMNADISKYNFIWFYQPFKVSDKAIPFYHKVIKESLPGTLIFGLDHFQINTYGNDEVKQDFSKLEQHVLDDLVLYKKL